MRFAATGLSGTIGRHIRQAHPLVTRLEETTAAMTAELQTVQARVVLHLAAATDVAWCAASPDRARRLNVDGAIAWQEAAARAGATLFAFCSSGHVFAPTSGPRRRQVGDAPDAVSVYGRLKAEAEEALLARAVTLGIPTVVIRVFSVFSMAMAPHYLGAALVRRIRTGDRSPLRGRRSVRDFSEAADVAALFERHLVGNERAAGAIAPVVHCCSGRGLSVGDLERIVRRREGSDGSGGDLEETDAMVDYLLGVPSPGWQTRGLEDL